MSRLGQIVRKVVLVLAGLAAVGSGICTAANAIAADRTYRPAILVFGLPMVAIFGLVAWWMWRGLIKRDPPSP